MNRKAMTFSLIAVTFAVGGFLLLANKRPDSAAGQNQFQSKRNIKTVELIACGGREVFIFEVPESPDDVDPSNSQKVKKLWSWTAAKAEGLPDRLRGNFAVTNECKPVDGGRRFFINAKQGGMALVNRSTGRVEWYTKLHTRPYSADILPGNRIVVVGGTHQKDGIIAIYDRFNIGDPLWKEQLPHGHAVFWDKERQKIWALGWDGLYAYKLEGWESREPKLKLIRRYQVPGDGCHDLGPVPGSADMLVTLHQGVWIFDRDRGTFKRHATMGSLRHVKSIGFNPKTKELAYTMAQETNWWSRKVGFMGKRTDIVLPTDRVYKVRWNVQGDTRTESTTKRE